MWSAGQKSVNSLLLSIDPASKKCTAKISDGSSGQQGATLPCELKFLDLGSHIVPITCRHASPPIPR